MKTSLPAITEKAFMAQVVKLARLYRWMVFHPFDSRRSAAGFPDLVLVRNRILYRELKTDTGRLTPDQQDWLNRLQAAGADADVWRPRDWDEIVQTLTRDL